MTPGSINAYPSLLTFVRFLVNPLRIAGVQRRRNLAVFAGPQVFGLLKPEMMVAGSLRLLIVGTTPNVPRLKIYAFLPSMEGQV